MYPHTFSVQELLRLIKYPAKLFHRIALIASLFCYYSDYRMHPGISLIIPVESRVGSCPVKTERLMNILWYIQ